MGNPPQSYGTSPAVWAYGSHSVSCHHTLLPRWSTHEQTVTHPSINRARRTATTLIETNALPLSYQYVYKLMNISVVKPPHWSIRAVFLSTDTFTTFFLRLHFTVFTIV